MEMWKFLPKIFEIFGQNDSKDYISRLSKYNHVFNGNNHFKAVSLEMHPN